MSDALDLVDFLLTAKRRTYAGTDDDSTIISPLLPGSKQLEHAEGRMLYRDIYVGMLRFVGQEMVLESQQPIWSMSYGGGVDGHVTERELIRNTYAFLRACLLQGTRSLPYRGPSHVTNGSLVYRNDVAGRFDSFHGVETIARDGARFYTLHYSGGLLK